MVGSEITLYRVLHSCAPIFNVTDVKTLQNYKAHGHEKPEYLRDSIAEVVR